MRYFTQRLIQLVLVFLITTFLVMIIIQSSSDDPARSLAGGISATPAQVEEVTQQYHLDDPFPVRYAAWVWNLIHLDLGRSPTYGVEVKTLIEQRAPLTILLGIEAILVALALAVPIAVFSAYRRDGWLDKVSSTSTFAAVSLPNVILAVLLAYVFATKLGWFPYASKKVWPWDDPWQHFRNMALPVTALAVGLAAVFTRLLRGDLINTLQSDFIIMARAKGLRPRRILWRHALRASSFALMTSVALQVGAILGGAVVIEQIFALPGMGLLMFESVQRSDLMVVQACAALFALFVVLVNFIVDMLYAVVDPRIRHARALG